MLLKGLPAASLTQTILRDTVEVDAPDEDAEPQFGPWSQEHYQLATLIDAVRQTTKVLVDVNSEHASPPLEPVPRPTSKMRRRHIDTRALDYLQAIRDRHRQEATQ